MEIANRVKTLTPSTTLAITQKAKELQLQGYDVIGLGAGEPDFNTPNYIIEAAKQAMDNGMTKYTPTGGIVELKRAIQNKLKRDNHLDYSLDEIIVTSGAKHALYTLFQVLLNEGDEVIIPAPYWVSYPEQVKLAGGYPVIIQTTEKNNFKLTPEELNSVVTKKTKALIINSPSNPTGMVYQKEELKALGEYCLEHNIIIISDEIYEKLIYTNDEHVSIAELSPELKANTVVINGVSKSHAMTGWRIGYAAGPKNVIKAMSNLASHSTSNPTSMAQYGALAAYEKNEDASFEMRKVFAERLDALYDLIVTIPGITCQKSQGAFYLFANVKEAALQNGFQNVDNWVEALLEEEKVAAVPGSGFGAPDYIRISYCLPKEQLVEAANRIKQFVEKNR